MKKMILLGLIAFGLLAAAPGYGQEIGTDELPVSAAHPDNSAFMAYAQNNIVRMRWGRTDNDEIDHYVVEQSTDSSNYIPLHSVVAQNGPIRSGFYDDAEAYPDRAVTYYRVTTFLKDGSSFSSAAVKVVVNPDRTPGLAPSVLQDGDQTLNLDKRYRGKLMIVEFFSPAGEIMKGYEVNGTTFNVNTTGWQRGLYFYRISDQHHALVDSGKILVE